MITNVKIGSNTENNMTEYNLINTIIDEYNVATIYIPFTKTVDAYEPRTIIDITVDGEHEYWIVQNDKAEPVDKLKEWYEHKITAIELTKILERYPMPNRAFVQLESDPQSALEIVQNLIATVPFRLTDDITTGKIIDSIDATLSDKLADVIIPPDLYLTGKTLKEGLVEIFKIKGIDGFPKLTTNQNGDIILDAKYYNELKDIVSKEDNSYFEQSQQPLTKYARGLNLSISNALYSFNKQTSFIVEPNPDGWLNVRSDTSLLNTDDAYVELGDGIDIIDGVEANITYTDLTTSLTTETFDISKYVYDEEGRKNLPPKSNLIAVPRIIGQDSTLGYDIGANKIKHVLEDTTFPAIDTVIELLYISVLLDAGKDTPQVFDLAANELQIRPRYSSKADITIEVEKIDLSETNNDSTLIIGQGDSFVSAGRALDSTLSRANRIGKKEIITKGFNLRSLSEIYKVGDYTTNGYILTEVERFTYADHFEALYSWSKDYQKVSEFIGLNSDPRLWKVNATLNRNDLYKQYIILDDSTSIQNETFVTERGLLVFANTISQVANTGFDKPVYAGIFKSFIDRTEQIGQNLYVPISKGGGGNLIYFWFGFNSYKNAPKQLIEEDSSFYNRNVEYTDDDGRFDQFSVQYVNNFDADQNDLPVVTTSISANDLLIDTEQFETIKNQADVTSFTYELLVYPKQSRVQDFIVGDYLTKNNNLINFKNGVFDDLYIYGTTERYSSSDTSYTKGTQLGLSYTVTVSNGVMLFDLGADYGSVSNPQNWALGDDAGNLYLAVNQIKLDSSFENISEIYFNFVKERY